MIKKLTQGSVRLVDNLLPDPFVFVLVLTLVTFLLAVGVTDTAPIEALTLWGDGIWNLLSFSMQMLLVLASGYLLASSPLFSRILTLLAKRLRTPGQAIIAVTLVSLLASVINWGFGLVIGAFFAKAIAKEVRVDYRLLVASAYSGFIVWHGGLSGSVPLTIATEGHFAEYLTGVINTEHTLFAPFNLILVLALFIVMPLINRLMLPEDKDSIYLDKSLLESTSDIEKTPPNTFAEKCEHARSLTLLLGALGLGYLGHHFFVLGKGLNLNVINLAFLSLALVLHPHCRAVIDSLTQGVKNGAGIVLQFPFYAGIMALMVGSGLAAALSESLIAMASMDTLPLFSFLSAGIVNVFVPSGGGQWAVQAPVVIPAAQALEADLARVAMAVAWGDAWTNLIQPFWALPVLAIAGLKAKDIMGFCLIHLAITGVIIASVLTFI